MTERIEHHACFGGWQDVYRHRSEVLGCDMTVGVYFPPQAARGKCPVLYWLSGLTCTEQNFITKAGAQRYAAEHGIILVAPDTSPRGEGVADADRYDLGQGAGFYVDATREPWARHYRMQEYIARELPEWVESDPAASNVRAIAGHSMGGHGALVTALRHPGRYRSVSAFSPIVAPSRVPWGQRGGARGGARAAPRAGAGPRRARGGGRGGGGRGGGGRGPGVRRSWGGGGAAGGGGGGGGGGAAGGSGAAAAGEPPAARRGA